MEAAAAIRIAIADDHPLMRAALQSALASLAPDMRFVEAANHAQTLALVASEPTPDLLLMDLHMPGAQGIEGVRDVRERAPHVPLAVVSADDVKLVKNVKDAISAAREVTPANGIILVTGSLYLVGEVKKLMNN